LADPGIERFFRENYPVIHAKCARMAATREEADDVAQEAFTRLWESGLVHAGPAARAAWIYKACTRLVIDRLRRRRLGVEAPDQGDDAPSGAAPPDERLAARQALAALAAATPRRELEVAVLCRIDGLTQPEAAELCGLSERTVRRLLGRFDLRAAALEGRGP